MIFFARKIIIQILALCFCSLSAQNPDLLWAKGIGGPSGDGIYYIHEDNCGNIYSTGFFNASADFNPGPGTYDLTANGAIDIFLNKLDPQGNFLWAINFGGNNSSVSEGGTAICTDPMGNVYVAGYFSGSADFDPGPGTYILSTGQLLIEESFLCKYSSTGKLIWAKQISLSGNVSNVPGLINKSLAIHPNGNLYLTGRYVGTADLDPGPGIFTVSMAGTTANSDIYVCCLNNSGNFVWGGTMGGPGFESISGVEIDMSGDLYLAGNFAQTADLDPGPGVNNLSSLGTRDIFLCKLSSMGIFIWAKSFGGSTFNYCTKIKLDKSNYLYFSGYFTGTADFDPGPSVYNLTASTTTTSNGFLLKINGNGNFVWADGFIGGLNNNNDLAFGPNFEVIVTGRFNTTFDVDPGPAINMMMSVGTFDAFLIKVDSSGTYLWSARIGNGGTTSGTSLFSDPMGNLILGGGFDTSTDFDPGPGNTTLNSNGAQDASICKFTVCNNPPSEICDKETFCSGSSATLSAVGGGTLSWFANATSSVILASGQQYVTPVLTAGTYSYYVEASDCSISGVRAPVIVIVNTPPSLTISPTQATICSGAPINLNASGAHSYSWTGGITSSSISLFPTNSIIQQLIGLDTLTHCKSTAQASIQVSPCTSLENLAKEKSIFIFPIPADKSFTAIIKEPALMRIYNGSGVLIQQSVLIQNQNEIGLEGYAPGIYYVTTESGNEIKTCKLIVE